MKSYSSVEVKIVFESQTIFFMNTPVLLFGRNFLIHFAGKMNEKTVKDLKLENIGSF